MTVATTHRRTSRVPLPNGRAYCYGKLAAATRPRDRLTVSQWADKHRRLSSKQSGEPGRWQTSRNPLLREIMDVLSPHSPVREVVLMKPAQYGATEMTVNWIGFVMHHAPASMMVLIPTIESRDTWKLQKLNPLFQETDVVREILGGMRSRDAANRQDAVDFPGGILFLAGGNSPNSYAQKSVRYLIMDDLDRFPAEVGSEGDPVMLARERVKSFSRSKILLISTPTVKDASLIEREYNASDRRTAQLPCPACGEFQALKMPNLKWNPSLTSVWYECEHCGFEIQEHHKPAMLAAGQWVPEFPERKVRGYQWNTLAAPIGLGPSWLELAHKWKAAQADNATLKAFINTNLGETWADKSNHLVAHELQRRCEEVPPRAIPVGCLALTIGVDTQDNWLAVTLLGHGAHHLWVLEYHEIPGDTTLDATWDLLEEYINTKFINAFGREIRPRAVAIDSRGHRAKQVKDFVQRSTLQVQAYAIQGATNRMHRAIAENPSHPDKTARGKIVKGGYGVWNVGTEFCKDFILDQLVSDGHADPQGKDPESRRIRFCAGLDTAYFNGLISEVRDPSTGRYVQKKGAAYKRNEPLDTIVYAWAIAHHKNVRIGLYRNGKPDPSYWTRLEAQLEPDGSVVYVPTAEQPTPAPVAPVTPVAPVARGRRQLSGGVR